MPLRIWLNPRTVCELFYFYREVNGSIGRANIMGLPVESAEFWDWSSIVGIVWLIKVDSIEKNEITEGLIDYSCQMPKEKYSLGLKLQIVKLGSWNSLTSIQFRWYPQTAIVLKQTVGSNATEVIERGESQSWKNERRLPEGMDSKWSYDVSLKFLEASTEQVDSYVEELSLLLHWWFSFLRKISVYLDSDFRQYQFLIGAFFVMQLCGLSINLITLIFCASDWNCRRWVRLWFVEAVMRRWKEHLSPYKAGAKRMKKSAEPLSLLHWLMVSVFTNLQSWVVPVVLCYRQFSHHHGRGSIVLSAICGFNADSCIGAIEFWRTIMGKTRRKRL